MTRKERAKLRTALSRLIARQYAIRDRMTTRDIYELAKIEHPDLIEEVKERMAREFIQNEARQLLKSALKEREEKETQYVLFTDEMKRLEVPRCIALPNPENPKETLWTQTMKATPDELLQYIEYLRKSAEADVKKADRLQAFYDYLIRSTPTDEIGVPIEDLLEQMHAMSA